MGQTPMTTGACKAAPRRRIPSILLITPTHRFVNAVESKQLRTEPVRQSAHDHTSKSAKVRFSKSTTGSSGSISVPASTALQLDRTLSVRSNSD